MGYFKVPERLMDLDAFLQQKEISPQLNEEKDTVCPNCQHKFNYNDVPESGMGYVKCPKCDAVVPQKQSRYADNSFIATSIGESIYAQALQESQGALPNLWVLVHEVTKNPKKYNQLKKLGLVDLDECIEIAIKEKFIKTI